MCSRPPTASRGRGGALGRPPQPPGPRGAEGRGLLALRGRRAAAVAAGAAAAAVLWGRASGAPARQTRRRGRRRWNHVPQRLPLLRLLAPAQGEQRGLPALRPQLRRFLGPGSPLLAAAALRLLFAGPGTPPPLALRAPRPSGLAFPIPGSPQLHVPTPRPPGLAVPAAGSSRLPFPAEGSSRLPVAAATGPTALPARLPRQQPRGVPLRLRPGRPRRPSRRQRQPGNPTPRLRLWLPRPRHPGFSFPKRPQIPAPPGLQARVPESEVLHPPGDAGPEAPRPPAPELLVHNEDSGPVRAPGREERSVPGEEAVAVGKSLPARGLSPTLCLLLFP